MRYPSYRYPVPAYDVFLLRSADLRLFCFERTTADLFLSAIGRRTRAANGPNNFHGLYRILHPPS